MIKKELIWEIKEDKLSKADVLNLIAEKYLELNIIKSKKSLLDGFLKREKQMTTGLADGVAIPHAAIKDIDEPQVAIVKLPKTVDWASLDGKPTDLVIAIVVPEDGRTDHFEILTKLSASLVDIEMINKIKASTPTQIEKIMKDVLEREEKTTKPAAKKAGALKIVGATTCTTGVAHTFMAAKAIEDECKKRGFEVRIEKQGQMTKDKLTQKEIDEADFVILAAGKGIEDIDRFQGKKGLEVDVAAPITEAAKVIDDMLASNHIIGGLGKSNNASKVSYEETDKTKKKFGTGEVRHLLSGISYMIPFIAMAGITLGLTTAFGYGVQADGSFGPNNTTAMVFNMLAGGGFTLFIPILGGMIAQSIAGRAALAPAMILSYVLNLGGAPFHDIAVGPFFNYGTGDFTAMAGAQLGFLGAIAAGYMVGYGINFMTKYTDKVKSQAFQTMLPLLIIPLTFTILPWVFFAFVGYLPLYGIGLGLKDLIQILVDNHLLFLAGILMGTMICFDLGGPVNKMAMIIAVAFLGTPGTSGYFPALNGIAATAVSIPPMVILCVLLFGKFFGFHMDENEKAAATSASIMGFFGITEGSIPFAASKPKIWMPSFMIAGAVGGALASFTGVGNSVAMWGGPIIWIAGGMGHSPAIGGAAMATDWVYSLLYFIPLIVAAFTGMFVAVTLNKVDIKKQEKVAKI